jgi:hypothetical protein
VNEPRIPIVDKPTEMMFAVKRISTGEYHSANIWLSNVDDLFWFSNADEDHNQLTAASRGISIMYQFS